jgi:tRNA (guanosine-2'-O-)-methyltransferase
MSQQPEHLLSRIPLDLHELAGQVSPDRLKRCLDLLDSRLNGIIVAAEAVHRRHNVSAILRSAEAFGIHEAHLIAHKFKASKGAARGSERWLDLRLFPDTTTWASEVKARGFKVYIADFSDDAVSPEQLPVESPIAVLFGGELAGVSDEAKAIADGVVTIPMRGVTQSLNVSVAAAVVTWTIAQRRREIQGAHGVEAHLRAPFVKRFLEREVARRKVAKVWLK